MPVDHYENFPVASILVPRHLRSAIEAIYAFARSADDFADEGDLPPADRLALLDDYVSKLNEIAAGKPQSDPLFARLSVVVEHHNLPISLFHDLLDAFKQDVTQTRYETFVELMDYCRRSANPIGRLLLHLYRQTSPEQLKWSDAICSSLQLINHWQDVAVDWGKNQGGRVYLPLEDLARFGLSERDIADQSISLAWKNMMHFQCQRARDLMVSGMPLGRALKGRIGAELRLVVAGGGRILDKIDAVEGDVFRHRPQLTKWDWFVIMPRALFG